MTWFCSSAPVHHDCVAVVQRSQHQDPESVVVQAGNVVKLNPAMDNFIVRQKIPGNKGRIEWEEVDGGNAPWPRLPPVNKPNKEEKEKKKYIIYTQA